MSKRKVHGLLPFFGFYVILTRSEHGETDMKRYLLILYVALLFGCGGSGGSSPAPTPLGTGSFWAVNFTTTGYYVLNAARVGEGVNCYVYLENGQTVSQSAINAIIAQFDSSIYQNENTNFGSEPNPGIDNDPKIYIVLLKVQDGFTQGTSTSFIAGYFDPRSEYPLSSQNPNSNQKEIFFMNINPATGVDPSGTEFFATIAHEFQHMIHWEQKTHLNGIVDDTWIDEAMAQVARTYCGYGPDYLSVLAYERDPNHSLINFDETVGNYGMAYMWAQYVKDRVANNIFHTILHNKLSGMNSVNEALSTVGYSRNFSGTFRDWAVANYFGDGITTVTVPPGHPEWSYLSINTWPGTVNSQNVNLPGLFLTANSSNRSNLNQSSINESSLTSLKPWSLSYYSYTPASGSTNGTVTWATNSSLTSASFINGNPAGTSATLNMTSNIAFPFQTIGYLINSFTPTQPFPSPPPGDTVAHTAVTSVATSVPPITTTAEVSMPPQTPSEVLAAMNANPVVRSYVQETGKPHRAYVDSWFKEKEKALRAQGIRPPF